MVERRVPGKRATKVLPSEVKAAQMLVARMRARGETPTRVVLAIAEAGPDLWVEDLPAQPA